MLFKGTSIGRFASSSLSKTVKFVGISAASVSGLTESSGVAAAAPVAVGSAFSAAACECVDAFSLLMLLLLLPCSSALCTRGVCL